MSGKERWLAVLNRQKPDRIPMDYWGTKEAGEKLMKHLSLPDMNAVFKKLRIDKPFWVGGKEKGPKKLDGSDMWGFKFRKVDYGNGSYEEVANHPLADFKSIDELNNGYVFPTADLFDYSHIKAEVEAHPDRIVQGGGSEPMLTYKYLRGDEQAFIDFIENPEFMQYILDKIMAFSYENTRRVLEQAPGKIHIVYVAEDLGSQDDLLYNPVHIRQFLFPNMKKMMDLTHQNGSYVFTHTDGASRKIIPELIELGMDVLNPIQWNCKGMGIEGLKKDFGDKIIFHGAVDNQHCLPFGTVAEVREEVKRNIEVLGKNGGYILAPCHNLQVVGPSANVVALYEAGLEYGSN